MKKAIKWLAPTVIIGGLFSGLGLEVGLIVAGFSLGITGIVAMIKNAFKNGKKEKARRKELNFNVTKSVILKDFTRLELDSKTKKLMINNVIYTKADILGCEFKNNTIAQTKKSTGSMVGRAVVGGALTGGVGAVIGGVTGSSKTKEKHVSSELLLTTNNINKPLVILPFNTENIAREWHSIINIIAA